MKVPRLAKKGNLSTWRQINALKEYLSWMRGTLSGATRILREKGELGVDKSFFC
jgi:hypothetical protein